MSEKINRIIKDIESKYLSSKRPWIVGFSGGKDSTCTLQLIYAMLKNLPDKDRKTAVYVLSSNTMVETPYVSKHQKAVCEAIQKGAKKDKLPIEVNLLKPDISDTFWVNVIGRGYPCPNRWFRWCTDRLKIKPMTNYIYKNIKINGEVLIVLGTRTSESASRAKSMEKHSISDSDFKSHNTIKGAFVYTPIEDLNEDEIWDYLLNNKPGWGGNNEELFKMYKGENAEIELVFNKNSPPTGHSRFGCWTCTVVEKDRAIESLIEEGHKEYIPLLNFRNELKEARDNPEWRESYRRNQMYDKFYDEYYNFEKNCLGKDSLGPFKLEKRHEMLQKLLSIEKELKKTVPDAELITNEELDLIQLAWIYDGDDIESMEKILLGREESKDKIDRLISRLLIVEKDMTRLSKRKGIYNKLEGVIEQYSMSSMKADR
jgi:DNA sulfur modification protein DndC